MFFFNYFINIYLYDVETRGTKGEKKEEEEEEKEEEDDDERMKGKKGEEKYIKKK